VLYPAVDAIIFLNLKNTFDKNNNKAKWIELFNKKKKEFWL